MASDPLLEALNAGTAARSAQRVASENHRYRWEQQWLRENNAISDVVDNGAAAHFAADTKQSVNANATQRETRPVAPAFIEQHEAARATRGNRSTGASEMFTAMQRRAPGGTPQVMPLMAPLAPRSLSAPPELSPSAATALAARQRSALKQFALWRSDDEIKVSLRVADADRDSGQTLGALRQWFKELASKFGLKLGTLIVNGQVRWQAKSKNTDGYY